MTFMNLLNSLAYWLFLFLCFPPKIFRKFARFRHSGWNFRYFENSLRDNIAEIALLWEIKSPK